MKLKQYWVSQSELQGYLDKYGARIKFLSVYTLNAWRTEVRVLLIIEEVSELKDANPF